MEPLKIDVHKYGFKMKQQKDLLKETPMLEENRAVIQEFIDFCKVDPKVHEARIIKYSYLLRKISQLVDKPFKQMEEKDITALLARLQDQKTKKGMPFSELSLADFRKAICKFWRWLYFDQYQGDKPPMIKRVSATFPRSHNEPEIYTRDEVSKIINGMSNARNKAFFSCVYDLSCRVSEMLTRQIKHVKYTEDGDTQILIEADKTGRSHWETLYESVPLFIAWMKMHPASDNPEAPLWTTHKIGKEGIRYAEPLNYAAIKKVFVTVIRKEAIRKGSRSTIHMLRKSKATHDLADGVPITYIESRGSWSKGSKALQDCYLSVQQYDKDNAYRKKYGMLHNNGSKNNEPKELKRCDRCQAILENNPKFCGKCGFCIDKTLREVKTKVNDEIASLVDKNMLSEMIKKIVTDEIDNRKVFTINQNLLSKSK